MWKVTLQAFGVLLLACLLGNFVLVGWFQRNDVKPQTQQREDPSGASETRDPSAASGTRDPNGASGTRNPSAALDDRDQRGASDTRNPSAASGTRDPTGASGTRNPSAALDDRDQRGASGTRDPSGASGTRDPSAAPGTRDPTEASGTRNPSAASDDRDQRGASDDRDQSCFCHLTGVLDDCFCDVESIDVFNNFKIYPRIKKLTGKDYFRYYRVNLRRPCPFWPDDGHCSIKDCHVESCPESKIPVGIKSGNYNKYSQAPSEIADVTECEQVKELGAINSTLSNRSKQAFADWARHDDAQDNFCELDDETSPDSEYVDLLLNPERFTGYKGPSAWRVWNSIYEENCFKPRSVYRPLNPLAPSRGDDDEEVFYKWLEGLCLEKRVFYRLISGLHSSINIHLCAEYLLDEGWSRSVWGPNPQEFRQRFDTAETKGEGTRRLKNLYFLYLIELRALYKVAPYFERAFINLYTGNLKEDGATKDLLLQVFNEIKSFPMHFDEKSMFAGHKIEAKILKEDFRLHFKNISRIMDCVGCSKCRLWGKLQTEGLGTALKILFSEKEIQKLPEHSPSKGFQLTRQEIVALINGFGRLSTSIHQLHSFRLLLDDNR